MEITVVTDYDGFCELRERWDGLLSEASYDSVFLTHEWFSAFIQGFDLMRKLNIVLIHEGTELIGILPLYRMDEKRGWVRVCILKSITNVHTPKYSFIMKKGVEKRLPEALILLRQVVPWDVIQADYVSHSSATHRCLGHVNSVTGWTVKVLPLMQSPFITLSDDWETYYANRFSRSLRKNIESSIRKAQKNHEVVYEVIVGDRLDDKDLKDAFVIEDSGWKGDNRSSILKHESFRKFYSLLAREANNRGWFSLRFLAFNGKRVAVDYCLTYRGTENPLKTGYDESCKEYAPGHILRKYAIHDAFSQGCDVYDLLGAADDYKMKMTNEVDTMYRMYFFNHRIKSRFMKFILFGVKETAEKMGVKSILKHIFGTPNVSMRN